MTDLFKERVKEYLESYLDFSKVQIIDRYIPDITIKSGIKTLVNSQVLTPKEITHDLLSFDVMLPVHQINQWANDKAI